MNPSRLTGTWLTEDGDAVVFLPSGAASLAGAEFRWSDDGAMLVLTNTEGNAVFLYQLAGDRLLLLGDAGPLPLRRVATAEG